MGLHFNIHPDVAEVFPASQSNEISEEYYWFLVGEINRRTIRKAVCRIEDDIFGVTSYYCISNH